LKKNLWKEAGLFNGSKGVIKDIICNQDDSLRFLLIEFEDFRGEGWNGTNLVPIEPIRIHHEKYNKHWRRMAPIQIADAMTVYKVQGHTLELGQIEFQGRDYSYAESYIAFSRFKRFEDFVIHGFDPSRYVVSETSDTANRVNFE
jgi:hypothetical protein